MTDQQRAELLRICDLAECKVPACDADDGPLSPYVVGVWAQQLAAALRPFLTPPTDLTAVAKRVIEITDRPFRTIAVGSELDDNAEALARDYLARVGESDDRTLSSDEWLQGLGGLPDSYGGFAFAMPGGNWLDLWANGNARLRYDADDDEDDCVYLPDNLYATRGSVRRLLSALGIPTKEGGQ